MARRDLGVRPLRGPLVAEDVDLPHPREHRQDRGEQGASEHPVSAAGGADDGSGEPTVVADHFLGSGRWAGHWTSAPSRFSELPEEWLVGDETVAIVEAAIAELPEMQRTVITLRDVHGWG